MTATSITSLEAKAAKTITLELRARDWDLLRSEYERLSGDANRALAWDRFLHGCVAIGLDQLQRIRAPEVIELLERLEG